MNFFKRLFKGNDTEAELYQQENTTDHLPADEQFALHFIEKGGRFIYCASEIEAQEVFRNILKELGVTVKLSSNASSTIRSVFEEHLSLLTSDIETSNVYLTDCEYLITSEGGIMLSSNQLRHRKIDELPEIFIVFAKTSQMVRDINEGMRGINSKYPQQKPTGLITLKCFREKKNDNNINDLGSKFKNTYLILLEDLPIEKP
jgi:hypothetical protein